MKKFLSILLSLLMVCSLAACSGSSSDTETADTTTSTETETADTEEEADETEDAAEPEEEPEEEEPEPEVEQEESVSDDTGYEAAETDSEEEEQEAETNDSAEITYTDEDLANVGITIDEALALIPEEMLYEHTFEEDIESWVDSCALLTFGTMDEDSWPGLGYTTMVGNDVALFAWSSDYMLSSIPYEAAMGDETASSIWESMNNLMLVLDDMLDSLLAQRSEDYHALTVLLSSSDEEHKVLLATFNGEIIYDAADEIE